VIVVVSLTQLCDGSLASVYRLFESIRIIIQSTFRTSAMLVVDIYKMLYIRMVIWFELEGWVMRGEGRRCKEILHS
jgi:hypothetical protein